MISFAKIFWTLCAAALTALAILSGMTISPAFAQAPTQQPPPASADPSATLRDSEPSRILRDALAAACEESETSFARVLTAAHADAFAHLAPERRAKLMQRLVLLDAPGKPPGAAGPTGRAMLPCAALRVTVDIPLSPPTVPATPPFNPLVHPPPEHPLRARASRPTRAHA